MENNETINKFIYKFTIMKIYHNPRCTKSRQTLAIIEEKGIEVEKVLYLENALTKIELIHILKKLGIDAEKLVRKSEVIYKEKYKGKNLSEEKWIEVMVENPKLIERPIVVKGEKAIIGRPPENVKDLF